MSNSMKFGLSFLGVLLLAAVALPQSASAQITLTGSVSPKPVSYIGTVTYSASASGGDAATYKYAFFRRRPGGTWIPNVSSPPWQSSSTYTWNPTLSDVGTWETYIWVKDAYTPASANGGYGYAAGYNTMPIDVIGPPTVPGPTSVSCAYTSGDECWVTGDFVISVSPSTGGYGSLIYHICRSNDTTGWGGCDVHLTMSGGTSITVSGSHLPSDGYRRAYYFQSRDSAGAYSGWNSPRYVKIDRYNPSVSASNASSLWYSNRTATISTSDGQSGLQSVRYSWNSPHNGSCTSGTAASSGTTLTAPTGDNILYLCARDNTGRVGQWSGSYRVSPIGLTGSISPSRDSYLRSFTYTANATGGTPSTMRYAFFRRRPGGTWIPDVNNPTWQTSNVYTWQPTLADEGIWETYIWVKDGDTPSSMNGGYGYAAGYNTMPIEVVGKPTIPGATTVACAYTSGDECWVQGDFTASVTASTGGMGTLVYYICRSNDTTGWGGCDVPLTYSGGTSILVSGTHLPADGYRRAYYFQSQDSAGAYSGWNTPRYVKVDRYAPSVSASNASDEWYYSRSAVVSASDTGSGVQSVRYSWGSALDASCTTGTATSVGASLTAPTGDNLLYLCAKDNTGRVGQWNGRYRIAQPLGLTGSISPSRDSYLKPFTYTANASGGIPSSTQYAFFRRIPNGTWIPSVSAPNWQASNKFTWQPTLADVGTWETYIWVKDSSTPANQNTYGYAAGYNTMPIEVVGKPTIPGPTTVACAYTTVDDCWVQGDFTASVTASTGGMSPLVYQICRSNDSAGGFAGCEANLTLSGGTSILVSGTNLPSDGFRRSYWFQAQDSAGALSGWNTQRYVRVDRYAPALSATNASDLWFSYRAATVAATDAGSGVQSVRYSWNAALDANCTTGTATSNGASLVAPSGDNLLYLCAKDNTGRIAQWNGRYRVSPMGLTGTVSPKPASYLNQVTYTATATGGTPSTTRYAFFRRINGGAWIPLETQPNWQASNTFTWQPTLSDVGTWETYIWVKDGDTPASASGGYGYAAGFNTGPVEIKGKPTVPGPTTIACAYSTADDCWVQGDFTATVTASTGGMGTLNYHICRSNDVTGWGGCEVHLTFTGGTSILVSGAHLPGDGYRRAYYFQTQDSAGAYSGWNTPRFVRVDRYPPAVSASNASDQWFSSRTATVSATDGESGIQSVRYSWNTALDANCTTGTATSSGATLTAPTGDNTLYLCAKDNTGRIAQWNGRYKVSAPLTVTSVTPSPAKSSYLSPITWTVTASGGVPGTIEYMLSRKRVTDTVWISTPWQSSNTFTWQPNLNDAGVWNISVAVRDSLTTPNQSYNPGNTEIVGKPTVPGPTTMLCDYSSAEDCWVNGENDVTASVTPSTGGMGNLVYQICRSNDSPGGFAGCEVNLTLNGGTSIVIPTGDQPADGFRRSYWFQAKDSAGALSGWNTPAYLRVDRNGPEVSATNASDQWFNSRTATVTATDVWGGAAANSGIRELKYAWNNGAFGEGCAGGTAVAPGTTLTVPAGDNMLYLCVVDNVGWNGMWSGRYRVTDALLLTGTVSPRKASQPNPFTWTATATGGDPSTRQFAFFRRRPGGTWIPDVNNPTWQAGNTYTWTPTQEDVGTWETYIWVKDANTPASANNGYGYAAGYNTMPIEVLPALTLTSTRSPAQAFYGVPIEWIVSAEGGEPETRQFALFRRRLGETWIPAVTAPAWQSSNVLTWTPTADDLGVWEIYIWVKDGTTPADQNTYGYGAGYNAGPVEIVEPPDFSLDLSPPSATIARGAQAEITIAIQPGPGFTGTAALSLSEISAGVSPTLQPSAIGADETALLTVATNANTPEGSYEIAVTAMANGVTRTASAQISVVNPQAPVLNRIIPDSFANGGVVRVTVEGSFLSGSTVSIAQEQANPDNPKTRVFPTAQVVSINSAGTSMQVDIDATDVNILDFHNLVVDNGTDVQAIPFRVLPGGPLVDAWTPSEPEVGGLYALSIAGRHLAGTTVTPSAGGRIALHSVETSETEITALLEVLPNAPSGTMLLIVADGAGRTAEVEITILQPHQSTLASRNLTATQNGKMVADSSYRRPTVWFQEFTIRDPDRTEVLAQGLRIHPIDREELQMRLRTASSFSWGLYIKIVIPLVRVQWQKVILFDPLTGAIGDAVLQALGVGVRVPIGAFVISAYFEMDLTIYWMMNNYGHYTFPLFCIEIRYGIEITGFDGFAYHKSFCVLGGWRAWGTGTVADGEMTGGECATVEQTSFENGILEGVVEQTACCSQPIAVKMSGHTFTGLPWGKSFSLDNPQAGKTTPAKPQCNCPVDLKPATVRPGYRATMNAYITNDTDQVATYNWTLEKTSGITNLVVPTSSGTTEVNPHKTVGLGLAVDFEAGNAAPDVPVMKFSATDGTCQASKTATVCPYPTGETSQFAGWSPQGWDAARFFGYLTPADTSFVGRQVTEGQPNSGAGSFDHCWAQGSPIPDYRTANLTGANWNIITGNTYHDADLIGFKTDLDGYYAQVGRAPCTMGTTQTMYIYCGGQVNGQVLLKDYATNTILIEVFTNGTKITRDGAASNPLH